MHFLIKGHVASKTEAQFRKKKFIFTLTYEKKFEKGLVRFMASIGSWTYAPFVAESKPYSDRGGGGVDSARGDFDVNNFSNIKENATKFV